MTQSGLLSALDVLSESYEQVCHESQRVSECVSACVVSEAEELVCAFCVFVCLVHFFSRCCCV